ncbi:MAG: HAD family hydrolase, partial [Gammaproteobacteria bacterium]|nr:HAD family hydrolase [Gammaproteobacteria bacterium]
LFPAMLDAGLELRGYNSPEYLKDCGTPERLDKVTADLESGRIARSSLSHVQPIVFLDRDGTINREVDHLRHPDQLELLAGAAEAIRRLNRSEYRCCLITNQPVIARGEASFADLRDIHARLDALLGQAGAYLDRVYVCPHHPDSGFEGERPELKIACDCRKPATGMIERAAVDFNMDRSRSWVVGDRSADIETARRAGLRSIVVQTGYGGTDGKYPAVPDHVAPDLASAVALILEEDS